MKVVEYVMIVELRNVIRPDNQSIRLELYVDGIIVKSCSVIDLGRDIRNFIFIQGILEGFKLSNVEYTFKQTTLTEE